jgi:hypothetical protein
MSGIVEKKVLETRKVFLKSRWLELIDEPPKKLQNFKGDWFRVDKHIFVKLCQYAYDMLFKTLDIFGLDGGIEGSGKTVDASQLGQMFHYIMTETRIISEELGTYYEYTEENCLAHDLESFNELSDKYNDLLFRIIICDEAGELKAEDRWSESNKDFRESMRKDRKKLRFRILCYPQPFELVKDFILGRTNFIRINRFSLDKNGFGSSPDIVDTIIIPRGDYTYSHHTKEIISRSEIKAALKEQGKEKYTSELQKKFIYKTSKKDDVFCFDSENYIKKAKEFSKIKKNEKKVFISGKTVEILAKHLTAGRLGFSTSFKKDKHEHLSKEEIEIREREKRDGLLIFKLQTRCKEALKEQNKTKV